MAPKGFTRPFTPLGKASIVPAFPWQFAGDLYVVHFKADPEALSALLPHPLTPSDTPDEGFLWSINFAVYPDEDGAEIGLNPAQSQYNVVVIGVPCKLNGENTMMSAFQWCDRDWLVVMSWFLGACSKLAEIDESKVHPLMSTMGSPQTGALGSHISRWASRNGRRIVSFTIDPDEVIGIEDMAFYTNNLPLTCERHFPDVHHPPKGRPDVHDLSQMVMDGAQFGEIRKGPATLELGFDENEELLPIQPTEVLNGYVLPMGFRLMGIRVIHDYLAQ